MKTAQLLPNIRYVSMSDDDGDFGMFLVHEGNYVYHAHEVHSREEFSRVYGQLAEAYRDLGEVA